MNFKTIFNNDFGRIDAEFFGQKFISLEKVLKSKKHKIISEFATVTDGEHGSPDLDENSVIKYLSGHNVKENYIDLENVRHCSNKLHQKNLRSALKVDNVLISIVGTIGRSSVVFNQVLANTDRNVATIKEISNAINSKYLSLFLNSNYGKFQTKRFSTGNVQPLLNLLQVKSIIVPLLNVSFQKEIELIALLAEEKRIDSKQKYTQAENLLLEKIGLQNFTPSKEPINIKSFKDSFGTSGRLDAEYYQKKYEDIENRVLNNSKGYTTIAIEFEQISLKSKKDKIGYNYIEIGNVNVSDGSCKSNYVETIDLPANAKTLVKKGDILISKVRPYRGAVTLINFEKDDLIVSGAFTVLREKETSIFSNEVLKVLLRTKEYKELLLKFNVGTSYPVIKDVDVLNLHIPKISKEIQKDITTKIQYSSKLKKQSEHLLEVAKKAVEIAIEENEEVALTYINQETK